MKPTETRPDDRELERYLLGLLPEEDTERLDELSIVDDEVASRLRVLEDDLVDAYVNGELARDVKARFEAFYLLTERRRQKVKFAQRLRRQSSPPQRLVAVSKFIWALALAATLLLCAGGALVYENVRLRNDLGDVQREGRQLLTRAQELERQLEGQRAAAAMPPLLPAIALVLVPQTRGLGGPIATLVVPQGSDRVALELRIDPNDFSQFKATLTDPATDHVVWRSETIAARVVDKTSMVGLIIPAGLLKAQHYAIELDGLTRAGRQDIVGSYTFQVVGR